MRHNTAMKKVLIATSKNPLYRAPLEGRGFAVTELALPAVSPSPDEIRRLPPQDFVITEAGGISQETRDRYRLLGEKGRVICLADAMTEELRWHVLDCGISDVMMKSDPKRLVPLMSIVDEERAGDAGSFIVLDDEGATRDVLRNIVARFNYGTVFIKTADELFGGAITPAVRFILINLGTRSLDLNGLVRKFYASAPARGIPVLAYKDMREGLFVHELVGGLNRLTRYILGIDELYGLLVDMLFRRELIPLVAQMKRESQIDANASFDAETLGQVFYQSEKRLFDRTDLLGDATLSAMAMTIHALGRAVGKVESLKWLKINMDRKDFNIAGREG